MRTLLLPSLLAALAVGTASAQSGITAVRGATVHTMTGAELADATVLIENGRIAAVGDAGSVEVPWNATVIDAKGKVVLPTWVLAHSSGGMRGGNENLANVPYLTIQDAIDPSSNFFEEALRNGIGTVHTLPAHRTLIGGQGMVCKPDGRTVEEMTVRGRGALKMSLLPDRGGRVAQIRKMRRALDDVLEAIAELERKRKEFEQEKAAGGGDAEFEDKLDPAKQPIADLLQGKNQAHMYVPDAASLPEALRIVAAYRFDCVLVLGPQTYKAAHLLRGYPHPVVLDGDLEFWEKDDDGSGREHRVCPAVEFAKNGVAFALDVATGNSGANRYPWWQMATLVRHGIDRDAAMAAMTTVPARILGLEAEVGTIAVGKRANLQVLSGDPLQATTWVEKVLLDGETVYDKDRDPRLSWLFGKTEEGDR